MEQAEPLLVEYWAFISYSRVDEPFAQRLQARIERYRIPRPLRRTGPHLRPIFRDVDELGASGELGERLRQTLDRSRRLIVLASPAAAASRWVGEEIDHFLQQRSLDDCIIVVTDGQPGGPPGVEPLPAALRARAGTPVWLDARGRRRLRRRDHVRLIAALLDVRFDRLWRRDRRRRGRRLVAGLAAAGLAIGLIGTVLQGQQQQAQRRLEAQRELTERAQPAEQAAAFRAFMEQELQGSPGLDGLPIDTTDVAIDIVRTDDVNDDSRLDFFVFNETPGFCGSGGCGMQLWVSTDDQQTPYTVAIDLFGHSEPHVRSTVTDGYKDISATYYMSGDEPIHSVFRWTGSSYELSHYEFCNGIFLEYCDPEIFRPLTEDDPTVEVVRPVFHQAPDASTRLVEQSVEGPGGVVAVDDQGEWYLVTWWKGESGFVHRSGISPLAP